MHGGPGASEANVVGEDCGLVGVAVAVDGVDAVEHGDPQARRQGAALHPVHHLHPRLRRGVRRRHAASAAHHAPCTVYPSRLHACLTMFNYPFPSSF